MATPGSLMPTFSLSELREQAATNSGLDGSNFLVASYNYTKINGHRGLLMCANPIVSTTTQSFILGTDATQQTNAEFASSLQAHDLDSAKQLFKQSLLTAVKADSELARHFASSPNAVIESIASWERNDAIESVFNTLELNSTTAPYGSAICVPLDDTVDDGATRDLSILWLLPGLGRDRTLRASLSGNGPKRDKDANDPLLEPRKPAKNGSMLSLFLRMPSWTSSAA